MVKSIVKSCIRKTSPDAIIAVIILPTIYLLLLPYLMRGSQDASLIGFLNWDEGTAVAVIKGMIARRSLDPGNFFHYGSLYFYFSLIPSLLFSLFLEQDTAIILGLRSVSLIGALLTSLAMWRFAGRIGGRWAGRAVAFALLAIPSLAFWATTAHPDTLQLLFIALATDYGSRVASGYRRRDYLLAIVFAALAFATKYSGIFLLPFIFTAALFSIFHERGVYTRRSIAEVLSGSLLFPAIYAVTNFYALLSFDSLQRQIGYESLRLDAVISSKATNAWLWMTQLGSDSMFGIVGVILLALGIGSALALAAGKSENRRRSETLFLAGWSLFYFLYLWLEVGRQAPRYFFPILPAVLALAGSGLGRVASVLSAQPGPIKQRLALVPLTALIFVAGQGIAIGTTRMISTYRAGTSVNKNMAAARWLSDNLDRNAIIYYDPYCYVPAVFQRAERRKTLNEREIARLNPEAILISEQIANKYLDRKQFNRLVGYSDELQDTQRFYSKATRDQLPGYRLYRVFGNTALFLRSDAIPD